METFKIHYSRDEYRTEYLQSEDWKIKSSKILSEKKLCQICEKHKSTEVHHLSYERVGFEDLNKDLAAVCRSCHSRIHAHKELAAISSLEELRYVFFKSFKTYILKESLYQKILSADLNIQMLISGITKVSIGKFSSLKKVKINYFVMQKIFHALNLKQKHKIQLQRPFFQKKFNIGIYELKQEKKEFKLAKKQADRIFSSIKSQENLLDEKKFLTALENLAMMIKSLKKDKSKSIAVNTFEKRLFASTQKAKDQESLRILKFRYLTFKKQFNCGV